MVIKTANYVRIVIKTANFVNILKRMIIAEFSVFISYFSSICMLLFTFPNIGLDLNSVLGTLLLEETE